MGRLEPEPDQEALVYCVIDLDGLAASFSCAVNETKDGARYVISANDGAPPVEVSVDRYLDLEALKAALQRAVSPALRALARVTVLVAAVIATCAPLRKLADDLVTLAS